MYQGDKQNYIPESSVYSDREILKAIHEVSKSKSKGQQREPAWFHPFPARMPISLAEHLIGRITAPEAVILDPMAGSGTTLIAEILRGVQKQQEINYKQAADRKEQPTPTTIFIEEAHEFLSAQRIQKMQVLFQQVARIARRGRKRWLGLVFITQLPQHLPDEVLGLINNWILHKVSDATVVSRLKRSIGGINEGLWRQLPSLAPGQAIGSFTTFTRPLLIGIDPTPCKLLMVD